MSSMIFLNLLHFVLDLVTLFCFSVMVQYHALGLMYHIRKTDRLAVIKLVSRLTKQSLKSPFAVCLLVSVRYFLSFLDIMVFGLLCQIDSTMCF